VLQRINESDASWESMVPAQVADMVNKRQLFGYRNPEALADAAAAP
jgi:hypothetical protein